MKDKHYTNREILDILESHDFTVDVEDFPKEVLYRMIEYQIKNYEDFDIKYFILNRTSDNIFSWCYSKEGRDFWNSVIRNKDFKLFFEKYPERIGLKPINYLLW